MRRRSGFGWMEFIEGLLLLALGVYTFAQPDRALTGFIVMYGIVAVTMGIADILLYVRVERFTGFGPIVSLISGALSVMTGVMLLVYPNAGKWVMSLLFPLWFLAHCIGRLSSLHTVRLWAGDFTYYFTLIMNVIGLILGGLMLVNPLVSWLSARYLVSFYLVLLGVDCIILAFSKLGSKE